MGDKRASTMQSRSIIRPLPFLCEKCCKVNLVGVHTQVLLPSLWAFLPAVGNVDLENTLSCPAGAFAAFDTPCRVLVNDKVDMLAARHKWCGHNGKQGQSQRTKGRWCGIQALQCRHGIKPSTQLHLECHQLQGHLSRAKTGETTLWS